MRIAHICLAAFYIDNYGYQENILPKYHKMMGNDIIIIASTETYIDNSQLGYVPSASYVNENGIQVHRLRYTRWLPRWMAAKLRAYAGLAAHLEDFAPELIFVHDLQFWDFLVIRDYAEAHGVEVRADCHADYVNSARGKISRWLLHGTYYKSIIQRVDQCVARYYPTLPARAVFMQEVYGVDPNKMELLPFGADDAAVAHFDRAAVRNSVRADLGISDEDWVFVTGGKIDVLKNIHVLAERFSVARASGRLNRAHLIVFGKPDQAVLAALSAIKLDRQVHLIGWQPTSEIYRYFWAADFALFPGTHSVLWEEAVGHGLGAVFRRWPGVDHLDLGGTMQFIDDATPQVLDQLLDDLSVDDFARARQMTAAAAIKGPKVFSYSAIADRAIAPIG